MWGCPIEAIFFNPNIGKLDPKTIIYHFIGYSDRSKGFWVMSFVEMTHFVFMKEGMIKGSMAPRDIVLEEKQIHAPMPMIQEPVLLEPIIVAPLDKKNVVAPYFSSYQYLPVVSEVPNNESDEPVRR